MLASPTGGTPVGKSLHDLRIYLQGWTTSDITDYDGGGIRSSTPLVMVKDGTKDLDKVVQSTHGVATHIWGRLSPPTAYPLVGYTFVDMVSMLRARRWSPGWGRQCRGGGRSLVGGQSDEV